MEKWVSFLMHINENKKIVMSFMEDGFCGVIPEPLWEGRETQKQSLCCCAQCSQSSAFLWLLYHLITAVECLLSAACLFLVRFESTAVFWFSSHYFASSFLFCFTGFLGLLQYHTQSLSSSPDHYNLRPCPWYFQVGLLWTASKLIFRFPGLANILYLPLLSLKESVRYIRFFPKLLINSHKRPFCVTEI